MEKVPIGRPRIVTNNRLYAVDNFSILGNVRHRGLEPLRTDWKSAMLAIEHQYRRRVFMRVIA